MFRILFELNTAITVERVQLDLQIGLDTREFQVNARDFIPNDVI